MNPAQPALDLGQSRRYRSIFRRDTKAAIELAFGMFHQIDIDVAALPDLLVTINHAGVT